MKAAQPTEGRKPAFSDYDYSHFFFASGDDPLNVLPSFMEWYSEAYPAGYYLFSEPLQTAPATRITIRNPKTGKEQRLLNLASYNYLGISYRPEVKQAAMAAIEKYGLGASGSPVLSGTFDIHLQLAEGIAAFKKKESAIAFRPATARMWAFSQPSCAPAIPFSWISTRTRRRLTAPSCRRAKTVFFVTTTRWISSASPGTPRQVAGLRRGRLLDGQRHLLFAGDHR